MPLTMLKNGEKGTIKRITGKGDTKRFLENLGFVIGADVSVVTELEGNVIVNVKDTRVAIGSEMANRIMV